MSIDNSGGTLNEASQFNKPTSTLLEDHELRTVDTVHQSRRKKVNCGVCTTRESLYKCSKCYLSLCSLNCSRVHKKTHPISPPRHAVNNSFSPVPMVSEKAKQSSKSKEPFASLDESKDLQRLFKLYPNLPNVLEKIHEATLPPSINNPSNPFVVTSRSSGGRKEVPWTNDIGLQKGVKALHAAQGTGDLDSEGVRAYAQLVLNIVNGNSEESTAEQIRRELVEQDSKIIQELLYGRL